MFAQPVVIGLGDRLDPATAFVHRHHRLGARYLAERVHLAVEVGRYVPISTASHMNFEAPPRSWWPLRDSLSKIAG